MIYCILILRFRSLRHIDITKTPLIYINGNRLNPIPLKKIKDAKDTILDSVLDEAESLLAEGKSIEYFKGIELYSKLLTRFKKV